MSNLNEAQRILALAVAKELGWATKPYLRYKHTEENAPLLLAGPNGELLWISVNHRDKSKVIVHGEFPLDSKNESVIYSSEEGASISVTLSRGIPTIAKSIVSRLLPDYTPLLAKVQARLIERNEYYNGIKARAARISTELGSKLAKPKRNINRDEIDGTVEIAYETGRNFSGEFGCHREDVEIKLRVPIELAVQIAKLIAAHKNKVEGKG
jgi:hypothetical protein